MLQTLRLGLCMPYSSATSTQTLWQELAKGWIIL